MKWRLANKTFHQMKFHSVDGWWFTSKLQPTVKAYNNKKHHIKLEMFAFFTGLRVFVCFWYLFCYLYKNEETYFISFPLGLIIIYLVRDFRPSFSIVHLPYCSPFNLFVYFSISLHTKKKRNRETNPRRRQIARCRSWT